MTYVCMSDDSLIFITVVLWQIPGYYGSFHQVVQVRLLSLRHLVLTRLSLVLLVLILRGRVN